MSLSETLHKRTQRHRVHSGIRLLFKLGDMVWTGQLTMAGVVV